jgi:hypothetical protein
MGMEQANERTSDPRNALCDALGEVMDLLVAVDSDQYTMAGMHGFKSSISAHARHCIDHVDALLIGLEEGEIRYDRRERGTLIEQDRGFAISAIEDRQEQVHAVSDDSLRRNVDVAALVCVDGEEQVFHSSGARETLYIFHHTVHHLALMAAHAAHMGVSVGGTTGRAPATIAADLDH